MIAGNIEAWLKELGFDHIENSGIEHIDDRQYKFSVYIFNQDGAAVRIRRGAITDLVIEDNILDWYHKGHITFQNPEDVIEKATSLIIGEDVSDPKVDVTPYRFRGDCRDFLYVVFEPSLHTEPDDIGAGDINSSTYTIKQLFTIYAVEDIQSPGGSREKLQKMYFHDYRYQMLREKNIYYSTSKEYPGEQFTGPVKNIPTSQMTDNARGKYTGEIIQDILNSALLPVDTVDNFSYHWDFGSHTEFYTSPCDSKALDDLNYILDRHVSSDKYNNQPCIFRLERQTERWELLPLTEYFKRSTVDGGPGFLQTEHFIISAASEADEKSIPPEKKTFGMTGQTPVTNYHFPDLSVINDYTFSEISGVDCQDVLNSVIVHRYNSGSKQFSIDLKAHNIQSVHDDFQSQLIDHTYGGTDGHGYTSWLVDSSRAENYNISTVKSWTSDKVQSMNVGRNRSMLGALLLGNTIQFNVKGDTTRRAGVWIAMDKNTNYTDNEYEMKVLGQYFITSVVHRFSNNGYDNQILGVKPYFYKQMDFNTQDVLYKDIDNG